MSLLYVFSCVFADDLNHAYNLDVLYAMGGYELNSVETLDLDYIEEGWNEIQPMTHERVGSAAVVMNRKIYALGKF